MELKKILEVEEKWLEVQGEAPYHKAMKLGLVFGLTTWFVIQ